MEQNELEKYNQELKQRLSQNLFQLQTAIGVAAKLEKKISDMESSKFWKAKLFYNTVRKVFNNTKKQEESGERKQWSLMRRMRLLVDKIFRLIRKFFKIVFKNLYLLCEERPVEIIISAGNHMGLISRLSISRTENELSHRIKEELSSFVQKPLISVILPVYNTPINYLKEAINSVIDQHYTNWELCIADDLSSEIEVRKVLEEYKARDSRIKVVYRKQNGHISACSNSAVEIAQGEFLALLDHDDVLTPDALYEVVRKINLNPSSDFIYSDEDKLYPDGSCKDAYYKPDWCPDSFLSRNYITHFSVIRRTLVNEAGGFRVGYEGSQDYDLFLRVTELTDKIVHIPKILYHWRIHPNSTSFDSESKSYAYDAAERALRDSLQRRNEKATIHSEKEFPGYYTLKYLPCVSKKVSIIIPTKDNALVLKNCIDSIFSLTKYENFEVIVVSNNSSEKKLFSLLEEYSEKYLEKFWYYENNTPFNYAHLMNDGAAKAKGELLLFLNNDTEVIHADWLEEMVGQAERKTVGAVGCKLLYPDNTVQHAGVVLGLGGIAGHVFVGEKRDARGYFCQLSTINNYSAVTGACLMCRKTVFEEAGGYDEAFKIEFNDVDFCLKIKELGYHNVYLPQVELYHHESLTRGNPLLTKKSTELHMKEVKLFQDRWQKYIDHDPCFSIHFDRRYSNYQLTV